MKRRPSRRQEGITLLELAFVLVVLGILASTLVPAISSLHHKSMEEDDRRTVRTLKEAIIGQFLATGALPPCLNAAGAVAAGNCDTQRSLGALPVRLADSRATPIRYDVWNRTTVTPSDLTTSTRATACGLLDTAIAEIAATIPPYIANQPAICQAVPNYDNAATFATYCTTPQNIAFVLVATGLNRAGQSGETAASSGTQPANRNIGADRVFERPERRASPVFYYDDLVEVVTLQELKAKCPL